MRRRMLDAAKKPDADVVIGLGTDVLRLRGIDKVVPHERDWRELGIEDVDRGARARDLRAQLTPDGLDVGERPLVALRNMRGDPLGGQLD